MSITYFAYGANLDADAMQLRCPGAVTLVSATLPGHRLVAMREGWLSVQPDPDETVEGLLWRLETNHLQALDRYEEVGDGVYTHRHAMIHPVGAPPREALIYQGRNHGPGKLHAEYAERVARAAERILGSEAAERIRALA